MGRRALQKVDPKLDTSRFLKTFGQLPDPWDASAVFGREAPLEIEIGSGKGLFLQSAAIAHPDRNFLGVEIAAKYARFCAARLAKHELANTLMVHGDAIRVVRSLLPDESVSAVHVYFPDPWWKKRHRKRRVMTEPFLREIGRILRCGARLHFWSDVKEYFDETLAIIAESIPLDGPMDVPERHAEHDLDYRTHFERRMRLAGEDVFRAEFEKTR